MISEQEVTLLDGGLGQEVYRRAGRPAHPLWSIQVMREQPEVVRAVHEDFIRNGARVLTLNTYTATPTRLKRDGRADWFEALQQQAFELADAARSATGCPFGPVRLAGCLPPLAASYRPETALPKEACLEEYAAIVDRQPNVDLFICETLPSIAEGLMAAEAAGASGKPVLLSFTLSDDESNTLRSGEPVAAMVRAVRGLELAGLLFNCSSPEAIRRALPMLRDSGFPFGAYANGFVSVEPLRPGGTVDVLSARTDLDPEAYAREVMSWVDLGATLVGGCCEVGPAHIGRIREELEARQSSL